VGITAARGIEAFRPCGIRGRILDEFQQIAAFIVAVAGDEIRLCCFQRQVPAAMPLGQGDMLCRTQRWRCGGALIAGRVGGLTDDPTLAVVAVEADAAIVGDGFGFAALCIVIGVLRIAALPGGQADVGRAGDVSAINRV